MDADGLNRNELYYDEKRRLTRSKIEYLLGATDYNALPERITRWRCAH
jgi:hypothetical protein